MSRTMRPATQLLPARLVAEWEQSAEQRAARAREREWRRNAGCGAAEKTTRSWRSKTCFRERHLASALLPDPGTCSWRSASIGAGTRAVASRRRRKRTASRLPLRGQQEGCLRTEPMPERWPITLSAGNRFGCLRNGGQQLQVVFSRTVSTANLSQYSCRSV